MIKKSQQTKNIRAPPQTDTVYRLSVFCPRLGRKQGCFVLLLLVNIILEVIDGVARHTHTHTHTHTQSMKKRRRKKRRKRNKIQIGREETTQENKPSLSAHDIMIVYVEKSRIIYLKTFRVGNTCTPMVESCQCMAKPIQYCKVKKKKDCYTTSYNLKCSLQYSVVDKCNLAIK